MLRRQSKPFEYSLRISALLALCIQIASYCPIRFQSHHSVFSSLRTGPRSAPALEEISFSTQPSAYLTEHSRASTPPLGGIRLSANELAFNATKIHFKNQICGSNYSPCCAPINPHKRVLYFQSRPPPFVSSLM